MSFPRSRVDLVGNLVALLGVVWILQGINVLPGSFMTGQIKWAYYGAIALVAGCVSLFAAKRMSGKRGT